MGGERDRLIGTGIYARCCIGRRGLAGVYPKTARGGGDPHMGDIRKMFDPKTIAVFGDMEAEGSVESVLLSNLLTDKHKTFWVHAR